LDVTKFSCSNQVANNWQKCPPCVNLIVALFTFKKHVSAEL